MSRKWFTLFIVTRMFTTNAFVLLRIGWWLVWRCTLAFIYFFFFSFSLFSCIIIYCKFSPLFGLPLPFSHFVRIISLGYAFRNVAQTCILQGKKMRMHFIGSNRKTDRKKENSLKWFQNIFRSVEVIFESIWFHVIKQMQNKLRRKVDISSEMNDHPNKKWFNRKLAHALMHHMLICLFCIAATLLSKH